MAFYNFFRRKNKNNNEEKNEEKIDETIQEEKSEINNDIKNEEIETVENNENKSEEFIIKDTEIIDNKENREEKVADSIILEDESNNDNLENLEENIKNEEEKIEAEIKKEIEEKVVEDIKENIENEEELESKKKHKFFSKVFKGLDKTRKNILDSVENVLKSFKSIDEELFEELEEVLIMADIGVDTSVKIINLVRDRVKKEKISEPSEVKNIITEEISKILTDNTTELEIKSPCVILMIGVNGVGKTTTIGKLAHKFKSDGKKVILAAADTFRAAAIDQLEVWGNRNNVDVIRHQENSDPGAVVFDAIKAAKARKADILICDTAGRLHNKKNLMDELKKITKIINSEYSEAQIEVFLALDATTGQNALQQAKIFKEVANLTGIVLTKLDGTAKGGVIIAIKNELDIPVRFIGIGEGIDDLQPFDAKEFAKALFASEKENK